MLKVIVASFFQQMSVLTATLTLAFVHGNKTQMISLIGGDSWVQHLLFQLGHLLIIQQVITTNPFAQCFLEILQFYWLPQCAGLCPSCDLLTTGNVNKDEIV